VRRPPPNPQEERVAPRLRDEDEGQ